MSFKDPERAKQYAREYYLRVGKFSDARKIHRPRTAYMKAWSDANPDRVAEYRKRSYLKHRDKRLAEARQRHKDTYIRKVSGQPGSIRYEAKVLGYRSGFERSFASNLKSRQINFEYETLEVPYILKCVYNPDFFFPEHGFYVETKGKLLYEDRRKHLAVKKQHPELDIRFCFMEAHKKMPGTKSTHAQWAERNGFKWCDKEIPEEWFNGQ